MILSPTVESFPKIHIVLFSISTCTTTVPINKASICCWCICYCCCYYYCCCYCCCCFWKLDTHNLLLYYITTSYYIYYHWCIWCSCLLYVYLYYCYYYLYWSFTKTGYPCHYWWQRQQGLKSSCLTKILLSLICHPE